jgi:hypothetical protein
MCVGWKIFVSPSTRTFQAAAAFRAASSGDKTVFATNTQGRHYPDATNGALAAAKLGALNPVDVWTDLDKFLKWRLKPRDRV